MEALDDTEHEHEPLDTPPPDPRDRLASAHRVWSAAWSGAGPTLRTGPASEEQPLGAHVERLARAALTDAIAYACDGLEDAGLERHVGAQLRAFLGDPEWATVAAELAQLRRDDEATRTPASVATQVRPHVRALRDIADRLPSGRARDLVHSVANADTAPDAACADRLYRELADAGADMADVRRAFDAACAIRTAFVGPPSP